jgi:hypothetical protein
LRPNFGFTINLNFVDMIYVGIAVVAAILIIWALKWLNEQVKNTVLQDFDANGKKVYVFEHKNLFGLFNANGETLVRPLYKKWRHINGTLEFWNDGDDDGDGEKIQFDLNENGF